MASQKLTSCCALPALTSQSKLPTFWMSIHHWCTTCRNFAGNSPSSCACQQKDVWFGAQNFGFRVPNANWRRSNFEFRTSQSKLPTFWMSIHHCCTTWTKICLMWAPKLNLRVPNAHSGRTNFEFRASQFKLPTFWMSIHHCCTTSDFEFRSSHFDFRVPECLWSINRIKIKCEHNIYILKER